MGSDPCGQPGILTNLLTSNANGPPESVTHTTKTREQHYSGGFLTVPETAAKTRPGKKKMFLPGRDATSAAARQIGVEQGIADLVIAGDP